MNWRLLCRMLGQLTMLVGGCMIFSLPWAFPALGESREFEERGFYGILASVAVSLSVGLVLFSIGRREQGAILRKEALAVVGLGWIVAGALGALPYLLCDAQRRAGVPMTLTDALFESVSGFTTTGASVLTDVEDQSLVPRCLIFWRSFTQWLGGMGIIVLFVAILGQLGASGKALLKREMPGPIPEAVRPRVQDTAIVMWTIYVGLSAVQTGLLLLEGLTPYHALCHTFGTMATGGCSTWNASVGHYGPLVQGTMTLFMILAGANFSLYYLIFRQPTPGSRWGRLKTLARDPEFRLYLILLCSASCLLTVSLMRNAVYDDWHTAAGHAVFNAVSIMTTTGFATEDFLQWGETPKGLLLALMFIGGCAGSTSGGLKVIRWLLIFKIVRHELERAYRPNLVRPLRIGPIFVDEGVARDVTVHFSLVMVIFVLSTLLLTALEADTHWDRHGHSKAEKLVDCGSAVASTLNNIGPGLGVLGPRSNYEFFSQPGKLLLTVLMLLGRLELFAILVLLLPAFWRTQ